MHCTCSPPRLPMITRLLPATSGGWKGWSSLWRGGYRRQEGRRARQCGGGCMAACRCLSLLAGG